MTDDGAPPNPLVIVGAGAAGLGAAYESVRRGTMPLVLEAAERPGGKIGTDTQDGFLLERAALALLDRTGELSRLCSELRLSPLPASAAARERYVERAGSVYALPRGPADFFRTNLLSAREKLSLVAEPLRGRARPDSTVARFFEKRLGAAGTFLGDAIQTGIYAGDPASLEMATSFPSLFRLEQRHGSLLRGLVAAPRSPRARLSSFRGGLQELVDALAKAIAPGLRLGTRLLAMVKQGTTFRLTVEDRSGESEVVADRLVLALPAPQAAEVLAQFDGRLAGVVGELTAAPICVVHLDAGSADVGAPQHGFGILRPDRPVVGALFPAALFPGRAPDGRVLVSALVGGARYPEEAALPDDDIVQLVRSELRLRPGARLLRVVRWPEALPQYLKGHAARIAALDDLTGAYPGLEVAGAFYRGVGVLDCLRDGARAVARLLPERKVSTTNAAKPLSW